MKTIVHLGCFLFFVFFKLKEVGPGNVADLYLLLPEWKTTEKTNNTHHHDLTRRSGDDRPI